MNEESVVRKFRTTAADGKEYLVSHYNLDMIIALGYRIRSIIATRFRQWATERLKEYIVKGFMGLLTFKGNHPTSIEGKTAKNYLNEKELRAMGQLVSGYLDFAERQAEREQVMTMSRDSYYCNFHYICSNLICFYIISAMTDRLEIARQIVEETCPHRRLKLENIQMFSEIIQCRKFHKGDVILAEGEVCTCLSYIEKGLTRQHYVKYEKDMTEHLSCEGGVVFCIESYFNGTPTHLAMEALEPTVIWEMPRDKMEELAETNADLAYLYRRFMEDSLMLSQVKADILRFESAKDRYTKLMQLFPGIIQRAPIGHIASYLQMSLETLSRVRSGIQ